MSATLQKTSEQLESEADELFQSMQGQASPDQDSDAESDDETAAKAAADDDKQEAPPPEKQDSGDELAGITLANAEARIQNAQARMHTATEEAATARREAQANAAQVETLRAEVASLKQSMEAKPAAEAQPQGPARSQDLESALSEYPEVVTPLIAEIDGMRSMITELKSQLDTTTEWTKKQAQRTEQDAARTGQDKFMDAVRSVHSDLDSVITSEDFRGWVDRQPYAVKVTLYGVPGHPGTAGTPADVSEVISNYKSAVGTQSKLDAARREETPSSQSAGKSATTTNLRFTRASIDAMSPAEFAKNEAAIDAAMMRGEIY